jgi:hypothetical protein|eukprot:4608176-Prymnesium_polylepis.1
MITKKEAQSVPVAPASGSAFSLTKREAQSSAATAAFSISRDFRDRWGAECFKALSSVAFNEADVDHSGTLEASELRSTLARVKIVLTEAECAEVLRQYDDDNNGRLDENEWHALLSDLLDGKLDPTGKSRRAAKPPPSEKAPTVTPKEKMITRLNDTKFKFKLETLQDLLRQFNVPEGRIKGMTLKQAKTEVAIQMATE